jgi:hypothetical protein
VLIFLVAGCLLIFLARDGALGREGAGDAAAAAGQGGWNCSPASRAPAAVRCGRSCCDRAEAGARLRRSGRTDRGCRMYPGRCAAGPDRGMQAQLAAAEAEGAACPSDVETADLTAQLKQARAEAQAAQDRAAAKARRSAGVLARLRAARVTGYQRPGH